VRLLHATAGAHIPQPPRLVLAHAFVGWGAEEQTRVRQRAQLARRKYRQRFGIETSYQQLNQGKGRTTKKNLVYRLLLLGLALLLRQVWVDLSGQLARVLGRRPKQSSVQYAAAIN
jgi:hypothetical protein